ncbi:hypothetical protein PAXINDRAFT_12175 [Paxillus involutus ATCC 200175]|uniref:Retrotransposon Copia-like N-terminal domain-containing protein n=1 Tax=Paxillus involutus ATCC 200175 TaxID=664439 RepID=A0A0C9U6V5_PAXIN|nr:hypothetical protein PAXINDRAFT_12175 [Paxillus involutus ATCC 200175]
MPSRGCYLSFSAFMDAGCRPVYVLALCVYRYQHLMFGLFVLAYLSLITYLGYQLVIFFFRNIFELHININDWHFDFTWDYIHKTPATASPVTWNSSTTTVVNPTPVEDLWPGHPTWNTTTWNAPSTAEVINNIIQERRFLVIMSSQLNLISVLTGANYLSWAPVMKGFLMAQGVSHVLTETCPSPTTYDDNSTNASDIYSWKQDITKALGYLILWVQENICVKHDTLDTTRDLWNALSTEYGTQGVSRVLQPPTEIHRDPQPLPGL